MRWLLTPFLCIAAIGVGASIFVSLASLKEEPPQAEPPVRVFRVPVYLVEAVDVRPLLSSFGTARSDQSVVVGAEVAGQIVHTSKLEVGLSVEGPAAASSGAEPATPGELVVQIAPETYRQRVLQAEAVLTQDDAELERLKQEVANSQRLLKQKEESLATAKAQVETQRRLLRQGAGRETEVTRAELEFQQVEAAVLQFRTELDLEDVRRRQIEARKAAHQQDLELARLDVQRSEVTAPFSGVISEVMVEQGQYVRAGDPLFRLTNVDRVEVALPIAVSRSREISQQLAQREQPRVQFGEHEAAACRWVGRVTRMSPVADETTRTVNVYAEIDNTDLADPLNPGTFVHGRIEGSVLEEVLLVPREAIVRDGVFVAQAGSDGAESATAEWRPLQTSGALQSFAIVTGGLQPGDRVVLTNLDVLRDGSELRVVDERTVTGELDRETTPGFEVLQTAPLAHSPQ